MDGRCATCKWWERWDATRYVPSDPDYRDHWAMCRLADSKDNMGERPAHEQSTAFVEGDHAGLTTREDHGCLQWTAKEV